MTGSVWGPAGRGIPDVMDATTLEWYEVLGRLGVAALLGAVVGIERGSSGHEAGLRTHVLVSVGSALFAAASVGAFGNYVGARSETNVNVDVTRMAAYVAPGIGFIGAGVIVKNTRNGAHPMVAGLTTAASLWTVAAIGVAAGLGFWVGAVTASALGLGALVLARPVSAWIERRSNVPTPATIRLDITVAGVTDDGSADLDGVLSTLGRHGEVDTVAIRRSPAGSSARIDLVVPDADAAISTLASALAAMPGVHEFDVARATA